MYLCLDREIHKWEKLQNSIFFGWKGASVYIQMLTTCELNKGSITWEVSLQEIPGILSKTCALWYHYWLSPSFFFLEVFEAFKLILLCSMSFFLWKAKDQDAFQAEKNQCGLGWTANEGSSSRLSQSPSLLLSDLHCHCERRGDRRQWQRSRVWSLSAQESLRAGGGGQCLRGTSEGKWNNHVA